MFLPEETKYTFLREINKNNIEDTTHCWISAKNNNTKVWLGNITRQNHVLTNVVNHQWGFQFGCSSERWPRPSRESLDKFSHNFESLIKAADQMSRSCTLIQAPYSAFLPTSSSLCDLMMCWVSDVWASCVPAAATHLQCKHQTNSNLRICFIYYLRED